MYQELVERLFSFPATAFTTFEAMQRLDALLGYPHRSFRSVHIGGTNGKGSVSMKIAKALQKEGFKVGLYTSPHIVDFRERIQVNGQKIEEQAVEDLLNYLFSVQKEPLSFFDLLTAMAFLYFKEQKIDWGIIEVGIGGGRDATNVIEPEAATIVSIGLDHTQILGDTLEAIAKEKEGIAKPGVPLIVGPSAAPFYPYAKAIIRPEPFYDLENQAVARAVLEALGISESAIVYGLPFRPPCRFEIHPSCILDVAHNPAGFKKLTEAIQFHFPNQKFPFAVAFTRYKDWNECLEWIVPFASRLTALRASSSKLMPPEELGLEIASIPEVCQRGEKTIFCGTFYIMAEVLHHIG